MITYIKSLKHKPEYKRKQILVGSMSVCMSIVALIWVYSLSDRFGAKPVAVAKPEQTKPFTLFADSIKSAYKNIAASVGNVTPAKMEQKSAEKQIDLIVVEPTGN